MILTCLSYSRIICMRVEGLAYLTKVQSLSWPLSKDISLRFTVLRADPYSR